MQVDETLYNEFVIQAFQNQPWTFGNDTDKQKTSQYLTYSKTCMTTILPIVYNSGNITSLVTNEKLLYDIICLFLGHFNGGRWGQMNNIILGKLINFEYRLCYWKAGSNMTCCSILGSRFPSIFQTTTGLFCI